MLHVIETDVLAGEDTAEFESPADAQALLDACMDELREAGVPVTGELLHSYGTHTDVARQILRRAANLHAGAIVLGPDTRNRDHRRDRVHRHPCPQPRDRRQPRRRCSRPTDRGHIPEFRP